MALPIGAIIGGATTAASMLGIGEGRQDKRQIRQQGAINDVNAKTAKEMADYEQNLKLKMWKDTNYGAQLEQASLAGVSKAAAIGGSGTGTQGASVSTGGGGTAADAAATQAANNSTFQQNMMLASQVALQKAQKENIEADTANKKAETTGKGLDNTVKEKTIPAQVQQIEENAARALAEAVQSQQKQAINEETMKDQIKTIQEEAIGKVLKNKGQDIENRKKQAELIIKQFEAKMAESGIAPNTPWYVKMLTDLADKHGLNLLK